MSASFVYRQPEISNIDLNQAQARSGIHFSDHWMEDAMIQDINSDAQPLQNEPLLNGLSAKLVKGLCGIIAVLVAVKAAAYAPSEPQLFAYQQHFVPMLAFAALTVWTALSIGIQRRGAAAVITLAFAVFVEMFLVPARDMGIPSVVAANLGIVLAYCGLQLYGLAREQAQNS
ncbi:MAG: hypothetical protein AAFR82_06045 [Pseudomonadota bacterium]